MQAAGAGRAAGLGAGRRGGKGGDRADGEAGRAVLRARGVGGDLCGSSESLAQRTQHRVGKKTQPQTDWGGPTGGQRPLMRGAGWPQLQHPSTGSTGRPLWKAPWGPQAPDSERLHLRTRHREPPEEMWRLPPSPLRAPAVHTALLGPAVARRPAGGHQVRPCTIAPPGASVSPSERRTAGPPATPAGRASGLAEEGLGAVAGADRREEGIAQVADSRRGRHFVYTFLLFCGFHIC